MATPQMRSVNLDPFDRSLDEGLETVEHEEARTEQAESRELPAYSIESEDETLAGIGTSGAPSSGGRVRHFDSSDRTLTGLGPVQCAEHAQPAESARHSAEPSTESIRVPHSEAPGPFIASSEDDETDVAARLPLQKAQPWLLASSALLVAAAAFVIARGTGSRAPSTVANSASVVSSQSVAHDALKSSEPRTSPEPLEIAAVSVPSTVDAASIVETPRSAASSTTALRNEALEVAPHHTSSKEASGESLGTLEISSNPPSGLILDGKPLGIGPRVMRVPTGTHTVLFVHPERGRMSVTVNVRAGRTTNASANF